MAYYVFDDAKNLFEGMTKEEIIAAIAQATGVTPASIDDGFITTIQEQNAQHGVKLWVGSQNEYNAIQQPDANTLYVVTDPHETNELQNQINQLQAEIDTLVAENTSNATGFKIEAQTAEVQQSQDAVISHYFTLPANFTILETAYCALSGGASNPWKHENIKTWIDGTLVHLQVNGYSDAGTATFKIVYAYPEAVDLSELTDIRVGYDGTVYETAGEAIRTQIGAFSNAGINDAVKSALLNLLAKVVYIDGNGRQYYDALEQALNPTAGVAYISAVFEQGNNIIYDNDSLDTLNQYLTVTAHYETGTSETVTTYTLSGTLTEGTSTITVSFGGKTTTFNVTVTDGSGRPWKTIALADLLDGGLQDAYSSAEAPYANTTRTDRTSYKDFDILVSSDYSYTFQFDGASASMGVPYYSNGVLEAVAAHQNISSYKTDPGWKASGYTFTPPSNTVCLRITFDKNKTTLENGGFTALNIFREAVTE